MLNQALAETSDVALRCKSCDEDPQTSLPGTCYTTVCLSLGFLSNVWLTMLWSLRANGM